MIASRMVMRSVVLLYCSDSLLLGICTLFGQILNLKIVAFVLNKYAQILQMHFVSRF